MVDTLGGLHQCKHNATVCTKDGCKLVRIRSRGMTQAVQTANSRECSMVNFACPSHGLVWAFG